MLKPQEHNAVIGIGLGWSLMALGIFLGPAEAPLTAFLGVTALLFGVPISLWGHCQCAVGRGYSGFWGLLGLVPFGIVVLLLLPDRHRAIAVTPGGDAPSQPAP